MAAHGSELVNYLKNESVRSANIKVNRKKSDAIVTCVKCSETFHKSCFSIASKFIKFIMLSETEMLCEEHVLRKTAQTVKKKKKKPY